MRKQLAILHIYIQANAVKYAYVYGNQIIAKVIKVKVESNVS